MSCIEPYLFDTKQRIKCTNNLCLIDDQRDQMQTPTDCDQALTAKLQRDNSDK